MYGVLHNISILISDIEYRIKFKFLKRRKFDNILQKIKKL